MLYDGRQDENFYLLHIFQPMKHSQTILTTVLYCEWLNSQQMVKNFVSPQYDSTKECQEKSKWSFLNRIPNLIFRRIQRTFIQDNMFNRLTSKQIPARERGNNLEGVQRHPFKKQNFQATCSCRQPHKPVLFLTFPACF